MDVVDRNPKAEYVPEADHPISVDLDDGYGFGLTINEARILAKSIQYCVNLHDMISDETKEKG